MQLERRTNLQTASHIDEALKINREQGAVRAWRYLMDCGVKSETIHRVLALDHPEVALPAADMRRAFDRRRL